MNEVNLSAVVIAKNEEKKIKDCLESLDWTDEIIVVDTGSTDKTINIAKEFGARVVVYKKGSYNDWRNKGLSEALSEWILYVDSDERVTPLLRQEIIRIINSDQGINVGAYAIPRKNIILGKEMKHGGWWPDYVIRLFPKKSLDEWVGALHEEPHYIGQLGYLKNVLVHLKHDNLSEMVNKSNQWSHSEAELFYNSGHPFVSWWRFLRIMGTELWYRLIVLKGFLDGPEGVIYALYQMWYRFIVYAKLWEIQISKTLKNNLNNESSNL